MGAVGAVSRSCLSEHPFPLDTCPCPAPSVRSSQQPRVVPGGGAAAALLPWPVGKSCEL